MSPDRITENQPYPLTGDVYLQDWKARVAYGQDILASRGIPAESDLIQSVLTAGTDYMLMGRFFNESGFGPDTKLGQLMQILVMEKGIAERSAEHLKFAFNGRVSESMDEIINNDKVCLNNIRAVQHALESEIFGEDRASELGKQLQITFFCHRGKELYGLKNGRKIRNQRLRDLVKDISDKFPLTVR